MEEVYRESCEQKGKEEPQYAETGPPDDLMLADAAVWLKVRRLRPHGGHFSILLMDV